MAIGAKLKELRLRSGESLQQVADAVGASKAHIWELETGKSKNPSIESITRLAEHFDVSVGFLIGEDPNAPDESPEIVAMFRDLKGLTRKDRETIRTLMKSFKEHANDDVDRD